MDGVSERRRVAGDVDYDVHGRGYALRRRADPRIAAFVHAGLGDARTVLNVGAGAGSYEPLDRRVFAVEPSATMRAQRGSQLSPAIHGVAESLPFDDQSFDASMAMVTVHQWPDQDKGLLELRRVTRGPIVVLTFEGDALARFWLAEYAPALIAAEAKRYPTVETICARLGGDTESCTVPIPIDCTDGFTEAFYARPEQFLDPEVRRSQSSWTFVSESSQARTVAALRADLASGAWDRKHGHWRLAPHYEGSLRLVVSRPDGTKPRWPLPAGDV